MAHHYADLILTKSFTPKEPQVELFETACQGNTIVSLINAQGKKFICCKVIEHFINHGSENSVVLYLVPSQRQVARHAESIRRLTCYSVAETASTLAHQIIVTTVEEALSALDLTTLPMKRINLVIIHECHRIVSSTKLRKLMEIATMNLESRVLGLAGSLLPAVGKPYAVETEISTVESMLRCKLDTASDNVTILQYGARPSEYLIEFRTLLHKPCSLEIQCRIEEEIQLARKFCGDHMFARLECEGFDDDNIVVPDPTSEPIRICDTLLHTLHNFGLYAANKAAFILLGEIESLKTKTLYERHFLLLCMVTTVTIKIRAILEDYFETMDMTTRLNEYLCPKILRLFEIIALFRNKQPVDNDLEEIPKKENSDQNLEECLLESEINFPPKISYILPKAKRTIHSEHYRPHEWDPNALCGLILVDSDFTARLLFYLLNDLKRSDEDYEFLKVHFTLAMSGDHADGAALEREYRKQELVLKNFRMRECNLLIGTSFLETGIDLPKCNLVVRFDEPQHFTSYAQGKARARGPSGLHCMLTAEESRREQQVQLACFHAVEQMLLKKGKYYDACCDEDQDADRYNCLIKPFCPQLANDAPFVDLSSAISLLNRYCSKLPSDTFTRLTAIWRMIRVPLDGGDFYVCKIRLPINSPIKTLVLGPAMPTPVLARRFAALQACLTLQAGGELDDSLLPITKETFWMREEELLGSVTDPDEDSMFHKNGVDVRPGTTKRRQYYNKRIAECLTDCRPVAGTACFLYHITMALTCPLPEEQNTRGRQIRAPEDSPQGFGILTSRRIPCVGAFPIFTRAGEVAVELDLSPQAVILSPDQIEKIVPFINFTFTSVLRLQKYLMMFDPDTSENAYFVVPTIKDNETMETSVDWSFLNLIYNTRNLELEYIADQDRTNFQFDYEKYTDAVVCPWYRNQDHPQYFYVAEICEFLTPKAEFPGNEYSTFEQYYLNKYGIQIQNHSQALLDVDHTSARLNFLTPRYVNRKGVALPTTSEAKKRAKRENLGQKQILVPELCYVHPFPASLWQKAVCLPCILHRLNALLLADEVRRLVASDLGLGDPGDPNISWKPLDFGWNLADVLKKSREAADLEKVETPRRRDSVDSALAGSSSSGWMEVGTWSNEQADQIADQWTSEPIRYGSPTNWLHHASSNEDLSEGSISDDLSQYSGSDADDDTSLDSGNDPEQRLHIQFKEKFLAEAVEPHRREPSFDDLKEEPDEIWECDPQADSQLLKENQIKYERLVDKLSDQIERDGTLCKANESLSLLWPTGSNSGLETGQSVHLDTHGTANNTVPQIVDTYREMGRNLPLTCLVRNSLIKYRVLMDVKKLGQGGSVDLVTKLGNIEDDSEGREDEFSFDAQPKLVGHPGPSPSLILQALTMSNANDGINLERLETIGDSFLKFAITTFLYCCYENVHEGKLSHLRSKQVSNLNLYRLGKQKIFAESMVATKFEPHDNWLPPCYFVPRELERALIEAGLPASHWNRADLPALHSLGREEVARLVRERGEQLGFFGGVNSPRLDLEDEPCFIPYNLMTQHSIPDKSVADCVEALIGAYLVACGPRGALLFMSWLGIKVLPKDAIFAATKEELLINRAAGHTLPVSTGESGNRAWCQTRFGHLKPPKPPLLRLIPDPDGELARLLTGFEAFEEELHYRFRDRSYLLQAVTHASYSVNQLTDCYQRLEFLGDAVLDYLITRHLYEDPRHHSPGSLTDLRSALVNNTIFASLAVRHGFHRFFRHHCPALHEVLDRFVRIQQENNHAISDECYLIEEDDSEAAEDVEVPKALGDVFESVAGAIFLDSAMSLDAVWRVYYRIMKMEIDTFSTNVPKSPIRELLELEPETAQFGKPEKLADGRRVRVSVEVFGKGVFKGIGRNYRIAKCTAAKCALKQLKRRGLIDRMK